MISVLNCFKIIFFGPRSIHCLTLSLIHSLTHSLTHSFSYQTKQSLSLTKVSMLEDSDTAVKLKWPLMLNFWMLKIPTLQRLGLAWTSVSYTSFPKWFRNSSVCANIGEIMWWWHLLGVDFMFLIDLVNTQCVGLFGNALTNLSSFDILETIKSEANQTSCNPTIFGQICMLGPSMLLLQKLNSASTGFSQLQTWTREAREEVRF